MTLGEQYIDGYKSKKVIDGKTYGLQVWKSSKREAEEVARHVRSKEGVARIIPSTYKGKRVYLVFQRGKKKRHWWS